MPSPAQSGTVFPVRASRAAGRAVTHSFCLSAAAQSSAPVPVSACARGCAECGVRFGVRAVVPQLCTARCSGLWAAAGFCLGEKKKASSFGARMVLFHPESAALMSWLLYVPVGAMLREGSAGHERPAADRGKTLTGSGDSGPGRDGERSSGPNRVRRRMEVGGCGSELRAAGGAPAALPAGAGRSAASAEPLSAARGRCAPGDGSAARGGSAGPVAVPLRTRTAAPHRLAVTQPGTRALFAPPEPGECSRGELWAPSAAVKSLPAIGLAAAEMRGGESWDGGTAVCCSPSSELPAVLRVYRCVALLTLPLGPVHLQGRRYGGAGRRSRSTERSRAGAVGLILLPKRTRLRFELSPGAVRGHSCLSSAGASRAARD